MRIMNGCEDPKDWGKLTTRLLVEIYGKQLSKLSAKGSSDKTAVDPHLFNTIYGRLFHIKLIRKNNIYFLMIFKNSLFLQI